MIHSSSEEFDISDSTFIVARSPGILHRLEQLINRLSLLIVGLTQFFVIGDGGESCSQIIQLEMRQRQIEVDERKARFDLRCSLIVETRERELTGVEIEIA